MEKSVLISSAKAELNDVRKRGHLFPPKMRAVVDAIRATVKEGGFALEDVGTSEKELDCLLRKAGLN